MSFNSLSTSVGLRIFFKTLRACFSLPTELNHRGLSGMKSKPIPNAIAGTAAIANIQRHEPEPANA